jgi:hypothetical protein
MSGINPTAGKVCTENSWTIEYKGRDIWGYCMDKDFKPLGQAKVANIYCSNVLTFKSVRAAKIYITKNT